MNPLRVVVVEDEALIALQIEALLEETGHLVAGWAASRADAERLIVETEPDLAFIDLNLADGPTGPRVAAFAIANGVGVVFVTANAAEVPRAGHGRHHVLRKPFTRVAIRSLMAELA